MTAFIVIAAVMAAAAIAFVAWPLFRARTEGRGAAGTLVVVALAIPLCAFLLYSRWSNWDWSESARQQQGTHSMEQAAAMLEARLAQNRDDATGWALLGRTRVVMGDFARAASTSCTAASCAALPKWPSSKARQSLPGLHFLAARPTRRHRTISPS